MNLRVAVLALLVTAGAGCPGNSDDQPLSGSAGSAIPAPATAATTTATPATTTGAEPDAVFTIAATGDVLVHAGVAEAARRPGDGAGDGDGDGYDFAPLLAPAAGRLSRADLALCHLETPLAPTGAPLRYGPVFSVPAVLAPALRGAGFDACSTASNHSLDAGPAGVRATLGILDAAGLAHAGTGRNGTETARPVLVRAGPAQVGLASFTFGLNATGGAVPSGSEHLVGMIDEGRILAGARAAREAGADFVVVSLHWGTEYRSVPDDRQRQLARRLLGSPSVDLIVGHHPHVVGPVERFGDKYVAYSLGNFLAGQAAHCCPSTRDGMILEIDVARLGGRYRTVAARAVPTRVTPPGYRVDLAPAGSASFCATTAAAALGPPCGAVKKPDT